MNSLKILRMTEDGKGIAYLNSRKIIVPYALIGELVEFVKGNWRVIKPSKFRTDPVCRYYGVCKSCNLQHASYEFQLKFKMNLIKKNLKKLSTDMKIENFDISPSFHYSNVFNYRDYNIDVKECPLVDEEINEILKIFDSHYLKIVGSSKLKNFIVIMDFKKFLDFKKLKEIYSISDKIVGIILRKRNGYRLLVGEKFYKDKVLSKTIRIHAFSSYERNTYIFEEKIRFIKDIIENIKSRRAIILDANFYPLFISNSLNYIFAFEKRSYNKHDLESNLANYDIFNVEVLSVDYKISNEIFKSEGIDLIILNKPTFSTIRKLSKIRVKNFIVIFDNLYKFYKFSKKLLIEGYEILMIKPFDTSPQTPRFDIIVLYQVKS